MRRHVDYYNRMCWIIYMTFLSTFVSFTVSPADRYSLSEKGGYRSVVSRNPYAPVLRDHRINATVGLEPLCTV